MQTLKSVQYPSSKEIVSLPVKEIWLISGMMPLRRTDSLINFISCIPRTYSRKNCELECQSNLIYQACGCVLYYMPRTSNETSICNRDDYDCYSTMMRAIELRKNETFSCHCMPACFEIAYTAEISNAHLGTENFYTKNHFIKRLGGRYVEWERWWFDCCLIRLIKVFFYKA